MSPTAVAALTQLLHACLAEQAMPSLQDIMRERQEKLDSPDAAPLDSASHASTAQSGTNAPSGGADTGPMTRQVEVRWYDARARTALKKVAEWTNVPWQKMTVFECLAAEQAQVLYYAVLCYAALCCAALCFSDLWYVHNLCAPTAVPWETSSTVCRVQSRTCAWWATPCHTVLCQNCTNPSQCMNNTPPAASARGVPHAARQV